MVAPLLFSLFQFPSSLRWTPRMLHVLAGRLGTAGLTKESLRAPPTKPRTVPGFALPPVPAPAFRVRSDDPGTWIERVSGRPLEFRTLGQTQDVTLVPFHRLFDERYAIYWKVTREA